MKFTIRTKSFEGHVGRKGQRGGSAPRSAGSGMPPVQGPLPNYNKPYDPGNPENEDFDYIGAMYKIKSSKNSMKNAQIHINDPEADDALKKHNKYVYDYNKKLIARIQPLVDAYKNKFLFKSFEGHVGVKGHRGGSAPKGTAAPAQEQDYWGVNEPNPMGVDTRTRFGYPLAWDKKSEGMIMELMNIDAEITNIENNIEYTKTQKTSYAKNALKALDGLLGNAKKEREQKLFDLKKYNTYKVATPQQVDAYNEHRDD